jgi:16S rRNA processing protein RimM
VPADHVVVGRVGRSHGVDGAFIVQRPSADERRFAVGATVYVDGVPATVTLSRRAGGRRRAIKLDRAVEEGAALTVPTHELPPPEPGHYYVYQLVGLDAYDDDGRLLGVVEDVAEGVANDNLVLASGVLVPMIEDAVLDVDLDARRLVIARPYAG